MIVDNLSPHRHPNVRAWAEANDVELVFLPTYASWLNWIESEFAALRYFAHGLRWTGPHFVIDTARWSLTARRFP